MRIGRTLSPGHPDRACDLIAETVVDEYLRRDPTSSLRAHVTGGKGALFVTGVVSSKADFDVGSVVTRAAAQLGTRKPLEPFVALEPAAGAVLLDALRSSRPIGVLGYATRETPEGLPRTVALSRRIAKKLEDLRKNDQEWFWFDPSFEVSVLETAGGREPVPSNCPPETKPRGERTVYVTCAHGELDVADVRARVSQALETLAEGAEVKVNANGPLAAFGLDHDIGSSGVMDEPYGSGLPAVLSFSGLDPSHPRKFGSWMAREVAKQALERSDAKAVLVQAVYEPGKPEPISIRVRDERGRDLSRPEDAEAMSYYALARRFRHGLNVEAARWGFAGEAGLPWEG